MKIPESIEPIDNQDPTWPLWLRTEPEYLAACLPYLRTVPVQVGSIASALNIEVKASTLKYNISGQLKRENDNPSKFVINVNRMDNGRRQRFTVAHEIGHFLLHQEIMPDDGVEDTIMFRSSLSSRQETEANKIASSILMPWNSIHYWSQKTLGRSPHKEDIHVIAEDFKVSKLAAGFRLNL